MLLMLGEKFFGKFHFSEKWDEKQTRALFMDHPVYMLMKYKITNHITLKHILWWFWINSWHSFKVWQIYRALVEVDIFQWTLSNSLQNSRMGEITWKMSQPKTFHFFYPMLWIFATGEVALSRECKQVDRSEIFSQQWDWETMRTFAKSIFRNKKV